MAFLEELTIGKINVSKLATGTTGTGSVDGLIPFYLKGTTKNISANGTTDTQTTEALTIPANTLVLQVYTQVLTSANATCSATIGDGTTANGWDASVNLKVAGDTRYAGIVGTDAYAVGKLYSAADTIDATITFSTSATTGAFRVDALCVKMP